MLAFNLFCFLLFSQSPSAEERANQHLQDAYLKQRLIKEKSDIAIQKGYDDNLKVYPEEEETSFGVIRQAPAEALPSFDDAQPTYSQNPLEQSYEQVLREREHEVRKRKARREYLRQFLKNAEKDGVKVQINENLEIENYKKTRSSPSGRLPGNTAGE